MPLNLQVGVGVESPSDGRSSRLQFPAPLISTFDNRRPQVGSLAGKAEVLSFEELELDGNGPFVTPDDAGLDFLPRPDIHKAITLLRHKAGQPLRGH